MSISWTVYARLGGTIDSPQPYSRIIKFTLLSWLSQTWCITAIVATKIGVAALIKRLKAPSKRRTGVIWILCSVCAAWGLIQIGFVWGQCRPSAALWDPEAYPDRKCWSPAVVVYNGIACSGSLLTFLFIRRATVLTLGSVLGCHRYIVGATTSAHGYETQDRFAAKHWPMHPFEHRGFVISKNTDRPCFC